MHSKVVAENEGHRAQGPVASTEGAVGARTRVQGRLSTPEEKMTILGAAAAHLWSERSFTKAYQT